MSEGTVLAAMGGLITLMMTALGVTVWYTITRGDKRADAERRERSEADAADRKMFLELYERERNARDAERERIDASMQATRHDLRNEIAVTAAKLAGHELYCAREYVSYPQLREALRPLVEGQEKIFDKLDSKVDKS